MVMVFTVVDATSGFSQVKLDAESKDITMKATPFRCYKRARMPFGISPAPELFQQKLDNVLSDLDGVMSIADDTIVEKELPWKKHFKIITRD